MTATVQGEAPLPGRGRGLTLPTATHPSRARSDRRARWVVGAGGIGVIIAVLGILLFLLAEVAPLLVPAGVERVAQFRLAGIPQAAIVDDYRVLAVTLNREGVVRAVSLPDGRPVIDRRIVPEDGPDLIDIEVNSRARLLSAVTEDGRLLVMRVGFRNEFEGGVRNTIPELEGPIELPVNEQRQPILAHAVESRGDEAPVAAAVLLEDGTMEVLSWREEVDFMSGDTRQVPVVARAKPRLRPRLLVMAPDQRNLYGCGEGHLMWWTMPGGEVGPAQIFAVDPPGGAAGRSSVTALSMNFGGQALLVGQADGRISLWFAVRITPDSNEFQLRRIRDLPPMDDAVRTLAINQRNRSFLALSERGQLGLYYSTTGDRDWVGQVRVPIATCLAMAPKGDGALVAAAGEGALWRIDNPHPDVSLHELFGQVWYESYTEPDYVWQSTGGESDDFEHKLSVVPLIVGTLKGTLFSMLLSIPIAVLGAMFVAHFMHPRLRSVIKPVVEIMAALPSVILGFVAAVWLSSRVEQFFAGLLLTPLIIPALVLVTGAVTMRLPARIRGRFPAGSEGVLFLGTVALGIWICLELSAPVEAVLFSGSFTDWVREVLGVTYEQRNAIVIGIAMSFAVIPIIFSIAEDSLSNVPKDLVSGSLALGANPWQTLVRVVLPTASPGIFAAVMIGFGRAIGETMIVVMATGNTPIMDWSPFNGFRAMSANIATELPEAPIGSTHYRVLFVVALILFLFTFVMNTAAEVVRHRLRGRYANL